MNSSEFGFLSIELNPKFNSIQSKGRPGLNTLNAMLGIWTRQTNRPFQEAASITVTALVQLNILNIKSPNSPSKFSKKAAVFSNIHELFFYLKYS